MSSTSSAGGDRSSAGHAGLIPRRHIATALAFAALLSAVSATVAEARGGRTTAADCAAGSDDPDCPDTDTAKKK